MDEITDQKEAVSHSLSLTCPVGASGQGSVRTPAAHGGGAPHTGLEIIKRALARHGECW